MKYSYYWRAKELRKKAIFHQKAHLLLVKKKYVVETLTPEELKKFEKKFKWYKVYLSPETGSRKFIRWAFFWNVEWIFRWGSRRTGKL